MLIHSWQIFTWPTVRATVPELINSAQSFRHWGTSLQLDPSIQDPSCGSTVWGCDLNGSRLGIAWEWVTVRGRAIAMGDPMTLLSNLELIDMDGQPVPDARRLLKLHEVIFALPWQRHVRDARWPVRMMMAA